MKTSLFMLVFLLLASQLIAAGEKEVEYFRQGTAYFEAQDYRKALKAFRQVVRLNPGSAEAHRALGMAYLKLDTSETATDSEMIGNAAAAFEQALRLAPDSVETRYQLGLAYLVLHDKKAAINQYEALKGLDAAVAQQLLSRISSYKAPKSFRTDVARQGKEGKVTRIVIVGNQLLVPVTLTQGDRTVQVTLLLDTGATCSLISRDIAQRLNLDLDKAPHSKVQVVGGGVVEAWHARLDRVTVGPQTRTGIEVAVVQENGAGFTADGLLGMNFLRSYKYSIDFTNQVINWSP